MRKISRFLSFMLLLSFALSISASAWYSSDRDQQHIDVPKVNPDNPRINFDGVVDLEGEWAGAAHFTFDMRTLNEELTVWDWSVWETSEPHYVEQWQDIPENQRHKWDYYLLWDDRGLYIAVVCETDTTKVGPLDVPAFRAGDFDGNLIPDRQAFMITPTDDDGGMDSSPGTMYWWYFYTETSENFWQVAQTVNFNSYDDDPNNLPVRIGTWRASELNAKGAYPYSMEIFIPWVSFNYEDGGGDSQWTNVSFVEGHTLTMGTIAEDRTGDLATQIRVTNSAGWVNYDFLTLAGPVETITAPAEAEEAPAETAAAADVSPAAAPAPVPAASAAPAPAPQTGDISIVLLIAAAASAAVFVKVKTKTRAK